MIGWNYQQLSDIFQCFSTSNVYAGAYTNNAGGLVGSNSSQIRSCFSTGDVNCGSNSSYLGGLVGFNDPDGDINDCYAEGSVAGGVNSYNIGGLAGANCDEIFPFSTITNCYSTGVVSGGYTAMGGFAGINYADILNSYFLETSGPDNGFGEPLTDPNMKQLASFVNWDFVDGPNDVWTIKQDVNYPDLVWHRVNLISHRFPLGWYEVDFRDFAKMAQWWGRVDCADVNDCNRADFDLSGQMDLYDLKIFSNYWLAGTESY